MEVLWYLGVAAGWPSSGLGQPQGAGGPEEGRRELGERKVAFRVHGTLVWHTGADEAEVVAASAPRTPPSTRAGGKDDVS